MNAQSVSIEVLQRFTPLRELGGDCLNKLALRAKYEFFPAGIRSIEFSWAGKVVYLLKGQIKLGLPDGGGTRVLVGGGGDALSPLCRTGKPPVNVRAISDIEFIWFDEKELDVFVTWDQMVPNGGRQPGSQIDPADWHIMSGIFDARKLTFDVFASLPPANIESLLASFQRQSVSAGEVIVKQNERGDHYYVIERGRALVSREVGGAHIELAQLQAGDAFGEEALVAEMPRNATVTMKTDGELLRLEGADFVRLLREPLLQRVDAQEALRLISLGAVWVDVRFPAEYRFDGLPGALNIPLNELRDALPCLARDKNYIVYCQTGRRSSAAAFLMSQRGLHTYLLDGGVRSMDAMEKRAA